MEWISVNDEMPDHNGVVLCYNANDPNSPVTLGVQVLDGDSIFYLFELEGATCRVTHWMELPQPPTTTADPQQ